MYLLDFPPIKACCTPTLLQYEAVVLFKKQFFSLHIFPCVHSMEAYINSHFENSHFAIVDISCTEFYPKSGENL